MNAALCFLGIIAIGLSGCAKNHPKDFSDYFGGFSVAMPGQPEKSNTGSAYYFFVENDDSFYMVAYWAGENVPEFPEFYKRFSLVNIKFEERTKTIDLKRVPGREHYIQALDRSLVEIYREYYTPGRTYRVMVGYKDDQKLLMDPQKFLDSFQLID